MNGRVSCIRGAMTAIMGSRADNRSSCGGGGPAGLAVAISATDAKLSCEVVEKGVLVDAIFRFPQGMTFFTTPELLEIGGLPFITPYAKPTKLEALRYYRRVVDTYDLQVTLGETITEVAKERDGFRITSLVNGPEGPRATEERARRAKNIVFATGYYDYPNRLGVPGEDLPHVTHYYDDPPPVLSQARRRGRRQELGGHSGPWSSIAQERR